MTRIKVNLYRRADDKKHPWWIDYRTPTGKRIRKPVSHRRDLADLIRREYELQINEGILDPEFLTVAEFFAEFISSLSSRAKGTIQCYQTTLDRFLGRYAKLRLFDVTPHHIQQFMEDVQHLAPATQARSLRELSVAFNHAIKLGYLLQNPCRPVRAPRVPKNPPDILSKTQVQQLLTAVRETPYHALIATALYAGLRRAELGWLEWEDVDLERSQIYVRNKAGHPLKDYEGRTVPIPRVLVEILAAQSHESNWVFPSPKGKRWNLANLSHRLAQHFKKAGISGRLHILRHTYASHLIMAGVDLASVQKLLGHANITTTMIYAHVAQEHLKKQVEKLSYE